MTRKFNRQLKALMLIQLLLTASLFTACPKGKTERPLVAFGYNYQIGLLLGLRTGFAFNTYAPDRLSDQKWSELKNLLKRLSRAGQDLSVLIDRTIEINPTTKLELLNEVERYLAQIDRTALDFLPDGEIRAEVSRIVGIIRDVAVAVKIAIAAIDINTPVVKAQADFAAAAQKAGQRSQSRAINTALVEALGRAAGEFAADIQAQKGMDVSSLRSLRDAKFAQVQGF